jgi:hypothetical protein
VGADGDTLVERIRQATKAVKPRPLGPKYREGDGPVCPEPGDHGRTYVMASGNFWCPVTQALFDRNITPLRGGRIAEVRQQLQYTDIPTPPAQVTLESGDLIDLDTLLED